MGIELKAVLLSQLSESQISRMATAVLKTVLLVCFTVPTLAAPQVRFGDSAVKTSGCGIQNGADRPEGSSWGDSDGCNTCTCVSGVAACTLMACSEEPPCRDVLGNFRQPGTVWNHVDGCNQCRCRGGVETCTRQFCEGSCIDDEGRRRENGSVWEHEDGCNECWCFNGVAPCTRRFCKVQQEPLEDGSCLDNKGNRRENGSNWTHEDGCNNCWCFNGLAPCTRKFCQEEPVREILPNNKCVGCSEESEASSNSDGRALSTNGKSGDESQIVFSA